ncbi:MAG: alcohol dehydrogenase [Nitrospirae bacterium CG_4_10_14_0_8_um_filter_41_23]|nr:alcohol dehydrogenase catalytic domain-containing protein [Nitrospirota bacterium]OIP61669.1 MAG: alcohol dehydrogenase [Nitrospirae bacterium CG2_30_41_42]PIQ93789.1 MAG: alcohol dehydrogenase [Nitrospirae bacterium CG11_big_fil_rev_8_21_14_0_20_41_14]PIV41461.1 MAG: alcohol dehydrogenase [Nitrospirae bacterium CG02_land_8_20_14_3_00_41_53]PIW87608.1 MAG: alcohol dehydrogenase [Nitrospirae bacterium CG_4_8_14_3_um_filter_41_47]PIY87804.1 MAG: alcohol dehydrogenase [Nitrospirae bacterium CG
MKAAVYYSNDDIRIEERPIPSISNGEILVKMMASGICGTDVMQWYRIKKAPRVLGHEMAGEIVEIGKDVEEFKKGDRVFVSHHVPCYKCRHCVHGNYTACESLHTGNYEPGGFSEFIRVPEENVRYGTFLLPERVTFEDATMIEPLGCVIAGQNQLGMKEGHTVLIIGSGVSGILHIQLANIKGTKVIATDIDEYRLNKAVEFGADYAIDASKYSIDELKRINDNRLADVVIVCAASKQAVENAISSVDRKGKILFFAVPENEISISSQRFWRDEITVTFSYGASPDDLQEAIKLIDSGRVNVRKMITHRIPLSDIGRGFKLAAEAKNSLKVVVVPDNDV